MRELRRAVQPAVHRTILGQSLLLPIDCRDSVADKDYPLQLALARGARCIYDVGSNRGVLAALMARAMPADATLTCFEANEATAAICRETMRLNRVPARVVNVAVADRTGALVEFADTSLIPGYLGQSAHLTKSTLALDDYAAELGERPDFIKIDVEGAERLVLLGARRIMCEAHPTIVVELHSLAGHAGVAENARTILPVLAEVGYRMIYLRTREVVTDAAQFGTRGRTHALCLPSEQPIPAVLEEVETGGL